MTWAFSKLAKLNTPPKVAMEKPILSFESEDFYQSENGFDEKIEAENEVKEVLEVVK